MEKKAKRTDEFDQMRDKNDLKERFLGQNFTQVDNQSLPK